MTRRALILAGAAGAAITTLGLAGWLWRHGWLRFAVDLVTMRGGIVLDKDTEDFT